MPAGVDFHDHLQEILADCGALLVVIGKSWRSQRKGQPARIMDPDDWVRIEVETALQRRIPVVPLLIDGASLPSRDQLPESLWPLLRRNALPVDSGRDFHAQLYEARPRPAASARHWLRPTDQYGRDQATTSHGDDGDARVVGELESHWADGSCCSR